MLIGYASPTFEGIPELPFAQGPMLNCCASPAIEGIPKRRFCDVRIR